MTTQHFVPEVWSATLLTSLETAHCYAAGANRDYEGEISGAGDTVRITSVSDPEIRDYVPGQTVVTPEALTTAQRALVITESKMFAFEVDDVDKRQQLGGIMAEGMKRAAYRLRDTTDRHLAAKMVAGVQAANRIGPADGTTPVDVKPFGSTGTGSAVATSASMDAYEALVQVDTRLTEQDIASEGRWSVIPPWYLSLLRLDERFVDLSANPVALNPVAEGTASGSETGKVIGKVAGLSIMVSNNVPVSGGVAQIVAGVTTATTFAEQIVSVEAYRPESSFSDAVKGLHVYGSKVVRPDHLALLPARRPA